MTAVERFNFVIIIIVFFFFFSPEFFLHVGITYAAIV